MHVFQIKICQLHFQILTQNVYFLKKINSPYFRGYKKNQFTTVQHTSGHVKVSTVYDHYARPTLLCTYSAQTQLNFSHCFLELFAILVATLGGIDPGSEVEIVAGAHVYPADPIGVQWDSSPTIWKAMEAH